MLYFFFINNYILRMTSVSGLEYVEMTTVNIDAKRGQLSAPSLGCALDTTVLTAKFDQISTAGYTCTCT